MGVERDRAVPETALRIDEAGVEQIAREYRPQAQHAERDQHRPRAFMRMIAGGPRRWQMRGNVVVSTVGGAFGLRILGLVMHGMLDMLGRRPTRLAKEGELGRAHV